jgi:hypothetical protein
MFGATSIPEMQTFALAGLTNPTPRVMLLYSRPNEPMPVWLCTCCEGFSLSIWRWRSPHSCTPKASGNSEVNLTGASNLQEKDDMKSRLVFCALLLALFAVPAFADSISISFTNRGILSGSSLSSGVSSTASDLTFEGIVTEPGPFATLTFDLGTFIGSFKTGGSFTGGNFELDNPGVIFQSAFSGTWEKVGSGLYDLVGSFSTTFEGVHYTGVTNQMFRLSFDDGHICLHGLRGNTQLEASVVPEPGTLTLLGTGLIGLAGAVRRKLGLG